MICLIYLICPMYQVRNMQRLICTWYVVSDAGVSFDT